MTITVSKWLFFQDTTRGIWNTLFSMRQSGHQLAPKSIGAFLPFCRALANAAAT